MPFYYLNFVKIRNKYIMIPNFKAHPWHGVSAGDDAPNVVTTFIEIVPADTIKYSILFFTNPKNPAHKLPIFLSFFQCLFFLLGKCIC